MKKNILFLMAWLVCSFSYGQGEVDAVRFADQDLQGTARAQAMGGAFGALGGDISGVAINPAGLGMYTSSEVTATISLDNLKYKLGTESTTNTNFRFDNVSYVGYFPLNSSGMSVLNFAFNYNRTKTYNREYSGMSTHRRNSLLDRIAIDSEGYDYRTLGASNAFGSNAPWLGILAWNSYLMDLRDESVSSSSYVPVLHDGELVDSRFRTSEEGGIDAYEVSLGTAIESKLYLGFSLAFTDISYLQYSSYGEDFHGGDGYDLYNYLETQGSGYQLKLGAIYRPIDELRLGVSFHSPTWYSMTDYYEAEMAPYGIRDDKGRPAESVETPYGAYKNYKYQTPSSWTFSAAGILAQRALISIDYKITDYSLSSFKDDGGRAYITDNRQIDKHQKVASNIRAGLEYRFTPQFAGRLGYAWYQNPYESKVSDGEAEIFTAGTVPYYTIDGDVNYFTAGFGYRFTPQFYLDAAFVYGKQDSKQYYYSPVYDGPDLANLYLESVPEDLKKQSYKALLTLGYKF